MQGNFFNKKTKHQNKIKHIRLHETNKFYEVLNTILTFKCLCFRDEVPSKSKEFLFDNNFFFFLLFLYGKLNAIEDLQFSCRSQRITRADYFPPTISFVSKTNRQ